MEGIPHPIPRTVEEVFSDFKGRRAGLIKALTHGIFFLSLFSLLPNLYGFLFWVYMPFYGFSDFAILFFFLEFLFLCRRRKVLPAVRSRWVDSFPFKMFGEFRFVCLQFHYFFLFFFLHYCSCAVFVVYYRGSSLILKGVKAKFSLLLPLTNEILTSFFRKLGFVLKVLLLYICCSSKAFAIGMLQIFVCD